MIKRISKKDFLAKPLPVKIAIVVFYSMLAILIFVLFAILFLAAQALLFVPLIVAFFSIYFLFLLDIQWIGLILILVLFGAGYYMWRKKG